MILRVKKKKPEAAKNQRFLKVFGPQNPYPNDLNKPQQVLFGKLGKANEKKNNREFRGVLVFHQRSKHTN